jgi:hypothetical protein
MLGLWPLAVYCCSYLQVSEAQGCLSRSHHEHLFCLYIFLSPVTDITTLMEHEASDHAPEDNGLPAKGFLSKSEQHHFAKCKHQPY